MKARNVKVLTVVLVGAAWFAVAGLPTIAAEMATPSPSAPPKEKGPEKPMENSMAEPEHITVQHILIGFVGSVPGKNITRSKEDAKKTAYEVLEQAKKGQSFDELVKKWTDDAPPGIYSMSNNGVAKGSGEHARGGMVPAFGNVGFKLKVGEIGIADYDPQASPYGWHIIKRTK